MCKLSDFDIDGLEPLNFDGIPDIALDDLPEITIDHDHFPPLTDEEEREHQEYWARLDELMRKHGGDINAVIRELRPPGKRPKKTVMICRQ